MVNLSFQFFIVFSVLYTGIEESQPTGRSQFLPANGHVHLPCHSYVLYLMETSVCLVSHSPYNFLSYTVPSVTNACSSYSLGLRSRVISFRKQSLKIPMLNPTLATMGWECLLCTPLMWNAPLLCWPKNTITSGTEPHLINFMEGRFFLHSFTCRHV